MGGLLTIWGQHHGTSGQRVRVASNIDSVFVGRFWGPVSLGVYNRAFTLFTLPLQQLTAPLTRVVLPTLSRIRDDALFLRYLVRAQLLNSYILVGALAIGASVAQPLIATTLGPNWSGVAPIFQVLALGGAFQALGYLYYWIFLARDMTGVALRYGVFGRAAMVVFLFVGVHFSVIGAAWGATAGSALLWLLYTLFAVPRAGIRVGLDYRRHDSGPSALHRHLHGDAGRPADFSQHWTPAAGVSCRVGADGCLPCGRDPPRARGETRCITDRQYGTSAAGAARRWRHVAGWTCRRSGADIHPD